VLLDMDFRLKHGSVPLSPLSLSGELEGTISIALLSGYADPAGRAENLSLLSSQSAN